MTELNNVFITAHSGGEGGLFVRIVCRDMDHLNRVHDRVMQSLRYTQGELDEIAALRADRVKLQAENEQLQVERRTLETRIEDAVVRLGKLEAILGSTANA